MAAAAAAAATVVGDGGRRDGVADTASDHPLAGEEWLASRILEHVADAREISRFALINRNFCEASLSDLVWEKRLPPKSLLDAIVNASSLHRSASLPKRNLYIQLCKSIPFENQLKKYWVDPSSGADCYMISARGLSVIWGDTPHYWKWQPWPDAMFQEVAYLQTVCWFDISGTFRHILRPGKYLVSFRMQLNRPDSWRGSPIKLHLQNISHAYPKHSSEVFFDGTTTFKRRFLPLPDTRLASQTPGTSNLETFVHPQGNESDELPAGGMRSSNVHMEEEQGCYSKLLNRVGARFLHSFGHVKGALPSRARCTEEQLMASPDDDILRYSTAAWAESNLEPQPLYTEWVECDVGELLVEDDNWGQPVEVQFSMQEIEVLWYKGGFVLDGVIIRPSFVAEKSTIE